MKILLLSLLSLNLSLSNNAFLYEVEADEFFNRREVQQRIDPDDFQPELLEAAIFHATNQQRKRYKKPALVVQEGLIKSARYHCHYLVEHRQLSHVNRRRRADRTPSDRIARFQPGVKSIGENLARYSILQLGARGKYLLSPDGSFLNEEHEPLLAHSYASLAQETVTGWMKSQGHRKNLLGDFKFLGVGLSAISQRSDGLPEIYITQNFAR